MDTQLSLARQAGLFQKENGHSNIAPAM